MAERSRRKPTEAPAHAQRNAAADLGAPALEYPLRAAVLRRQLLPVSAWSGALRSVGADSDARDFMQRLGRRYQSPSLSVQAPFAFLGEDAGAEGSPISASAALRAGRPLAINARFALIDASLDVGDAEPFTEAGDQAIAAAPATADTDAALTFPAEIQSDAAPVVNEASAPPFVVPGAPANAPVVEDTRQQFANLPVAPSVGAAPADAPAASLHPARRTVAAESAPHQESTDDVVYMPRSLYAASTDRAPNEQSGAASVQPAGAPRALPTPAQRRALAQRSGPLPLAVAPAAAVAPQSRAQGADEIAAHVQAPPDMPNPPAVPPKEHNPPFAAADAAPAAPVATASAAAVDAAVAAPQPSIGETLSARFSRLVAEAAAVPASAQPQATPRESLSDRFTRLVAEAAAAPATSVPSMPR